MFVYIIFAYVSVILLLTTTKIVDIKIFQNMNNGVILFINMGAYNMGGGGES